jgi:hypothetical protein
LTTKIHTHRPTAHGSLLRFILILAGGGTHHSTTAAKFPAGRAIAGIITDRAATVTPPDGRVNNGR